MQGVLAVVPPLHIPLGRRTLVETNKTYEPTSSNGSGHDRGCSDTAHPSAGCYSSLRLTPISGRFYLRSQRREEKGSPALGSSLAVLWSLVTHNIAQMYKRRKDTQPIAPPEGFAIHPRGWKPRAFWLDSVRKRVAAKCSQQVFRSVKAALLRALVQP